MKKLITLLILISLQSCVNSKTLLYSVSDFTTESGFTKGIEGPAVDSKGNLYAVNYKEEGTIGIVNKNGKSTIYTKLTNGSVGNGIRFDKNDNMYIADYTNHNILLLKKDSKTPIIYAHNPTMNQPNDIALAPNGTLYASDPNWKDNTGNIWLIKKGETILLEKNMGTTNGIEVSPNGKKLYVNESVQKNIWVYDINEDNTLKNKTLFKNFKDFGLDGMRCDQNGNLFVCRYGKGTIAIISPQGQLLKEIILKGKKPSNITFGGKNNMQCFVTMADRGCFETFLSHK